MKASPNRINRTTIIRWTLHAGFAAYLLLGIWDVRNPEPFLLIALACGFLLSATPWLRGLAARMPIVLKAGRLLDVVFWNAFLSFILLETALAAADHLTHHPLLIAPNAKSQERIQRYRASYAHALPTDTRNSLGFNDTEWVIPKPPGTFRIVALGDSFAFGIVGYQRNFLTILERELTAKLGRRVEIANLGIPSTDPTDYLELLSVEGLALDPDLILVCFFSGNDFVHASRGSLLRFRNTRLFAASWRLGRWRTEAQRMSRDPEMSKLRADPTLGSGPTLSAESYKEVATRYLEFLRSDSSVATSEKVDDTLGVLDKIVALAKSTPVVVAVLPNEVQVNPELRRQVCAGEHIAEESLDLGRPPAILLNHFADRPVAVVDLLPAFAEAEKSARTHHPRDSHWNVYGNRIASEVLLARLLDLVQRSTDGRRHPQAPLFRAQRLHGFMRATRRGAAAAR